MSMLRLFALGSLLVLGVELAQAQTAARPLKIVLLGDSFTAGTGAAVRDDNGRDALSGPSATDFHLDPKGCFRRTTNWGSAYEELLENPPDDQPKYSVDLVNAACHGAVTADVLGVQGGNGKQGQNVKARRSKFFSTPLPPGRGELEEANACDFDGAEEETISVLIEDILPIPVVIGWNVLFTCNWVLRPQIDAVAEDTDLVLMTIGANDLHFGELVSQCFFWKDADKCEAMIDVARTGSPEGCTKLRDAFTKDGDILRDESGRVACHDLSHVTTQVTKVLEAIHSRSPLARVVILDYPYIELHDWFAIGLPFRLYPVGQEIRALGDEGDEAISQAVAAANAAVSSSGGARFAYFLGDSDFVPPWRAARFSNLKTHFKGREPTGFLDNSNSWIHDINWLGDEFSQSESYHPNEIGHTQIAALLLENRIDLLTNRPLQIGTPYWAGDAAGGFTFRVYYFDQDGEAPTEVRGSIDGTISTLKPKLETGSPADGVYTLGPIALGEGQHTFSFSFANASESLRSSATVQGPLVSKPPPDLSGRNIKVETFHVTPSFVSPGSDVTLVASFKNIGKQAESITAHFFLYGPDNVLVDFGEAATKPVDPQVVSAPVSKLLKVKSSAEGAWTAVVWGEIQTDDDPSDNRASRPLTVGEPQRYTEYQLEPVTVRQGQTSPVVGGYSFRAAFVDSSAREAQIEVLKNGSVIKQWEAEVDEVGQFESSSYVIYFDGIASTTVYGYHGIPVSPNSYPFTYVPEQLRAPQGGIAEWKARTPSGKFNAPARSDIIDSTDVRSWFDPHGSRLDENGAVSVRSFKVPPDAGQNKYSFYVRDNLQGTDIYYLRASSFIVDVGHDISVSHLEPANGARYPAGTDIAVSTVVSAGNGYSERPMVSLVITGPGGYVHSQAQSEPVSGSKSTVFAPIWQTGALAPGLYTLTVRADVGFDILPANNVASATIELTAKELPPPAPRLISCVSSLPDMTHVSWADNSSNEAGFRVERSQDGILWVTVCSAPAESGQCADTQVSPDTTYSYQVVAYNSAGASASNILTTHTQQMPSVRWTYPNDAEQIQRGREVTLNWTSKGAIANVAIELLKGGLLHSVLVASTPNSGSMVWPVPADLALGSDYTLRVRDVAGPAADTSDAPFSVVVTQFGLAVRANISAAPVAVSPTDLDGRGDGQTPFIRRYAKGTTVRLTAQAPAGTAFQKWTLAGDDLSDNPVVELALDHDQTLTAIFVTASDPPPVVTSVEPADGPAAGSTKVTIRGSGFATGATVAFGGTPAAVVGVLTDQSIVASTPPHASGVVDVQVTNPDEQSSTLVGGYTYWGTVSTEDLIAHYPLDGSAQNTASGQFQGTLRNGPVPIADRLGRPGKAMHFSEAADQWVEVTERWFESRTAPFSMSAWIRIDDLAAGGGGAVNSLLGRGAYLSYLSGEASLAGGIRKGANDVPMAKAPIPERGWYHVVGTWRGSVDGRYDLWVNGKLVSSITSAWELNENSYASGIAGNGYNQGTFTGGLDDVWIFGRALPPEEILALYRSTPVQQHQLTVTTAGTGAGQVKVNGALRALPLSAAVDAGTTVTLEAVPAAGSVFSGWSGALTGADNPTRLTMIADAPVTATFVKAGELRFSAVTYSVAENAGKATLTVSRSGGSGGAVSARIESGGGTATAGMDYGSPEPAIVTFADGDEVSKPVELPILDDWLVEGTETINLALVDLQGGAVLGDPGAAVVTILDDDHARLLGVAEGSALKFLDTDGIVRAVLPADAPVADFDVSDDGSRVVYTTPISDGNYSVWLFDFATRARTFLFSQEWCQTISWLPATSQQFVYAGPGSKLYRYDVSNRTSSLWQDNSTVSQAFGLDTFRGGIAWDARASAALVRVGASGAGGDIVLRGNLCEAADSHHLCNLQAFSPTYDGSTSWANVSFSPALTSAGDFGYYVQRINWNEYRLIRKSLVSGMEVVIAANNSGLGAVAVPDDGRVAVVGAPPGEGNEVLLCSTEPDSCASIYSAQEPLGALMAVPVVGPFREWLEVPPAGAMEFGLVEETVPEGAGELAIPVVRSGGTAGALSALVSTGDVITQRPGLAIPGIDYVPLAQQVMFGAGESGPKFVTLKVIDDRVHDGTKTLRLMLQGEAVGTNREVGITITDDDPLPPGPSCVPNPSIAGQPVNLKMILPAPSVPWKCLWQVVCAGAPGPGSFDPGPGYCETRWTPPANPYSGDMQCRVSVQAVSADGGYLSGSCPTHIVQPRPPSPTIITPSPLPHGYERVSYYLQLQANSGTPPYRWSIVEGSLPPGLWLDPVTGIIRGTPTSPVTASFKVVVTDSANLSSDPKQFSLTIQPGAPAITTSSPLPDGRVGEPYSFKFQATGGLQPYTWTPRSNLPPGLILLPDGTLAGTPAQAGTWSLSTVRVTGANGQFSEATVSLTVHAAVLRIIPPSPPDGTLGVPYFFQLEASGGFGARNWLWGSPGPLGCAETPGSYCRPPDGLALSPQTGTITGTPSLEGIFDFIVTVQDQGDNEDTKRFRLTVRGDTISIISVTATPAQIDSGGQTNLNVEATDSLGHALTYRWTGSCAPPLDGGAFPNGDSVKSPSWTAPVNTTGATQTCVLSVTADDGPGRADSKTGQVQVSVTAKPARWPTCTPNPSFEGAPVTLNAQGAGLPLMWQVVCNDPGLGPSRFDPNASQEIVKWTPPPGSGFKCLITVQTVTEKRSCPDHVVLPRPVGVRITTSALPDAIQGTSYSATLEASGGRAPLVWSVEPGSLPPGLTLSGNTITGTPTAPATSTFKIKVQDADAKSDSREFTLEVQPGPPTILTLSPLPNARATELYAVTFEVTGGLTPYTYSVSGTLPPGIASFEWPTLHGTPTTRGDYSFVLTVKGANNQSASREFTLKVLPGPILIVPPITPPTCQVGVPCVVDFQVSGGVPPYFCAFVTPLEPPGTFAPLEPSICRMNWTPTSPGVFPAVLRVTDSASASEVLAFTITVQNKPDVITITSGPTATPASVASAGEAALAIAASDSFDHGLTFQWASTCTGAPSGTFAPAPSAQSPTWKAPANTTTAPVACTLTVTVDDGQDKAPPVSRSVSVTVLPARPPVDKLTLISGPTGTPNPSSVGDTVALGADIADKPGRTQSYLWQVTCAEVSGSGSFAPNQSSATPTWTPPTNPAGGGVNCLVRITCINDVGESVTGSYFHKTVVGPFHTVTVSDAPTPPEQVASAESVPMAVAAADSQDHDLAYTWEAACAEALEPGTFTPDPAVAAPTWVAPTNTSRTAQPCTLSVRVEDGQGEAASRAFTVAVAPAKPSTEIWFSEGARIRRVDASGNDLGDAMSAPDGLVVLFAPSADRRRVAYSQGWGDTASIAVCEIDSQRHSPVFAAPWVQTLTWLPGSSTQFIFNGPDGYLYAHDLTARAMKAWQTGEWLTPFGLDTFRGGFAWNESGDRAVVEAGVGGSGFDRILEARLCEVEGAQQLCRATAASDPGADAVSLAYRPVMSAAGDIVYYLKRIDADRGQIIRRRLATKETEAHGPEQVLREISERAGTELAHLALVDDEHLAYVGPTTTAGTVGLYVCRVESMECALLHTSTSGIGWMTTVKKPVEPIARPQP